MYQHSQSQGAKVENIVFFFARDPINNLAVSFTPCQKL